jgi:hypothetical protein
MRQPLFRPHPSFAAAAADSGEQGEADCRLGLHLQ